MSNVIEERFNHKQSQNYFSENGTNWLRKTAVIYLLYLLSMVLNSVAKQNNSAVMFFIVLLSAVVNMYITGYFIHVTYNRIYKPEINIFDFEYEFPQVIYNGLKTGFAGLLYMVLILIIVFTLISLSVVCMMAGGQETTIIIGLFYVIITSVIVTLILAFWYLGYLVFLTDLKFSSFFNIKRIKELFSTNKDFFYKLCGWLCVYGILGFILILLLAVTIVGILAVPIVLIYLGLVISDLTAQFIRKALVLDKTEEQ